MTLSTVLITVVTVARLLIVSNYQVPTASAVAQTLGPVSTLTGSVLPVFGAVLPLCAMVLVALTAVAPFLLGFAATARLMFAATLTALATMTVSPTAITMEEAIRNLQATGGVVLTVLAWGDYLPVGLAASVIFFVGLARSETVAGFSFARYLALAAIGTTVVSVFALVAYDAYPPAVRAGDIPQALGRMWLPAEQITVTGGPVRVGYVLSSTEVWTTILWEDDRTIGLVPSDHVTARSVCRLGPADELPLISRAERPPSIAPCLPTPAVPVR
ncbi:hypothetical protein H7X46_19130 [Pseudonocardia sp. C8]|uniref:hypothetical protein n=1 Tax=Pseudonocardia sp. C8 TaxID=2762759 RepID=UPI00164339DD|nr:hypothetical protein [Pseudonocardia sp. C8]MBC3193177.1 hypothetical protein [Pseudonocardia sp. C8]